MADEAHPKSLVSFIIEAINEVAPDQGRTVYWRAFERFNAYADERARQQRRAELRKIEKWTEC